MLDSFKSAQRGFSLFSLIFFGAILAVVALLVAQVVPTAIEYQSVLKAAQKASESSTVVEVRSSFDKAASINDIRSISGKDIEVSNENGKMVVSFAYQREIHLAGPAYLTLKYARQSH
ncbi:hypothetical protein GALL_462310 [mine drainage metagenome]|uniref:DUF4845 domain-containing protein n=1 Tax=mine drainage metagenome TaxID=410659 RepID=A0A1J5PX55_9ZZZZ